MITTTQNLKTQIQDFLNTKYDGTFRFLKEGMFRNNFGDNNLNEVILKTNFLNGTEYDIFSIRVRSYILGLTEIPKCYCGVNVKFHSNHGWLKYCSKKCSANSEETFKKRGETNMEKYGVENVFSNNEVREKIKETTIKKYGVDNYAKLQKSNPQSSIGGGSEVEYLNESKLGEFLSQRLSPDFLHDKKLPESDSKKRYDYIFTDLKLIFEFDGYGHYTNAEIVINDEFKDAEALKYGYKLIRIPYFVQLSSEVINIFFGDLIKDKSDFSDYPHGFIDKHVVYPSDFCELGMEKFNNFLDTYKHKRFVKEIISNLIQKVEENGERLVIYKGLKKYLNGDNS